MILVAAALIVDRGRMLLAQRPAGAHLAGLWEFPGGKVEAGETPEEALARELREELGVEAHGMSPFHFVHHRYREREVLILLYRCSIRGAPRPLAAAAISWFTLAEARALAMPEADGPLLEAIADRRPGSRRPGPPPCRILR